MNNRGVLIEITLGGRDGAEDECWSGSGFVVASTPFSACVLTSTSWMKDILIIPQDKLKLQPCLMRNAKVTVYQLNVQENIFHKAQARVVAIVYLKEVHRTLQELENKSLNNWTVSSHNGGDSNDAGLVYLSCVAILYIETDSNTALDTHLPKEALSLADDVYVISTPFGSTHPQIFYNSVSRGCVSNIYGTLSQVFLINAPCVPGSEGGMVLTNYHCHNNMQKFSLAGMMICTLVNERGLPVNASLVCSWSSIVGVVKDHVSKLYGNQEVSVIDRSIVSSFINDSLPLSPSSLSSAEVVPLYSKLVLPVSFGSSVATGIIISDNLILTCGHVVQSLSKGMVKYSGRTVPVSVLYCSHGGSSHVTNPDIAVLLMEGGVTMDCSFDVFDIAKNNKCIVAEPVISVGYTYQNPFLINAPLNPVVTSGVISKLIPSDVSPVMIQSTACVYRGMSGGLLCGKDSAYKPIGLLTCVARDEALSFDHSSLSFAIPFSWIKSAVLAFKTTGDVQVFELLEGGEIWSRSELIHCKL